MKKAIDHVTIEVNYERPHFDFPALSSEAGNPMVFWKMAKDTLYKHGFTKEAQELPDYKSVNYHDQFNMLARYLDFSDRQEVLKEDEEYLYVKIKKTEFLQQSTKQLPLFKINNQHKLEELYLNGMDLTVTNCYGRNLLYYLDDYHALSYVLELNKTEKLFDLFAFDNMSTTILYAHSDNLPNFSILLKHMAEENTVLANMMLHGMNEMDVYPLEKYLKKLDNTFAKKGLQELDLVAWEEFGQSLKVIKTINPELHQELLNMVKNIPLIREEMKKPARLQDADNPIIKIYQHFIMDNTLRESAEKKPKMKI